MVEIQWIESRNPRHSKVAPETDIRVSLTKYKDTYRTTISFYNDSHKKVTHGDKVMAGITPTRVYFQEAAMGGYKICRPPKSRTAIIYVPAPLKEFVGEYKLQYDGLRELYFIEKEESNA